VLGASADERDGFKKLIGKAEGKGWLTATEAESLRAGAELRNRIFAHPRGQAYLPPGTSEPMIGTAHAAG
jgi:hypothetical protein